MKIIRSREPYFKNTTERMTAFVISCAMFMESLDTTIINTAVRVDRLPATALDLSASDILKKLN